MKYISAAEKFMERKKCRFKIHFVYFTQTP